MGNSRWYAGMCIQSSSGESLCPLKLAAQQYPSFLPINLLLALLMSYSVPSQLFTTQERVALRKKSHGQHLCSHLLIGSMSRTCMLLSLMPTMSRSVSQLRNIQLCGMLYQSLKNCKQVGRQRRLIPGTNHATQQLNVVLQKSGSTILSLMMSLYIYWHLVGLLIMLSTHTNES